MARAHNVMVERLWRSVKYERAYLQAYDSVAHAKADIAQYVQWYNSEREHSSLNKQTPDEAYSKTFKKPLISLLKISSNDALNP